MIRIFRRIWSVKSKWKTWHCSFELRKNIQDYINSKQVRLWLLFKVVTRNVLWTLFMLDTELRYRKLIEKRQLEHPKPCQFIASRNHSLVKRTESKGYSKACKARNRSHVQVDFRPYNEEHITVRNKTFICLGLRKDSL